MNANVSFRLSSSVTSLQYILNKSVKFNIASDIIPRTIYKGQPEPSNNEITEDDDDTI
jgi:hypothetical protein